MSIDDLQNTLPVGPVLHTEFLHKPRVIYQVVPRDFLAAGVLVERDLRPRQELPHNVGEFAQADRLAAGVVDPVLRLVLHDDAGEDFRHLVEMDWTAHRVPEWEPERVSARRR